MIRSRTPRDDRAILELVRNELVPRSSLPAPSPARLRREMARRFGRGATFVAVRPEGSVAGFVHVEVRDATLYVDLLAVAPADRNRGWGRALMQHAERYGLARGCRQARLFVDEGNIPAQRFYWRLGYWPVRRVKPLHCIEMVKWLVP
jgi:ribosomal protein S18 acetylase RimI-like enzyme